MSDKLLASLQKAVESLEKDRDSTASQIENLTANGVQSHILGLTRRKMVVRQRGEERGRWNSSWERTQSRTSNEKLEEVGKNVVERLEKKRSWSVQNSEKRKTIRNNLQFSINSRLPVINVVNQLQAESLPGQLITKDDIEFIYQEYIKIIHWQSHSSRKVTAKELSSILTHLSNKGETVIVRCMK
ncbi:hypothetical protein BT96DRAFT_917564 [Gymnopus androsaceus JB14]|uniref:Uncharacterized protein n=1 Tax=Gymnopus androsaceus JB14 TaxID=1447944 RepID=A0A6A4HZZ7_9AGAR|nr:hypothetical protein BT96DRAFT_917564 [Gymnopus androsaceus JB14]